MCWGGVGGVIGEEWLEEVQISGACEENAKLYLGFTVTAICVAWKKNKIHGAWSRHFLPAISIHSLLSIFPRRD